jgi:cell division protease FtsH
MISDIIDIFLSFLINTFRIFSILFFLNIINKMLFNENLFNNNLSDYILKKKKNNEDISLKDVIGLENVKEDLKEYINYIKFKKQYKESGFNIPKGLLFAGPPGTGKTMLAKALANETNSKFIYSSGSDFIEIYVGVGAKRIRELFNKAKKNKPAIIFIDEIDTIGRNRDGISSSGHNEQGSTLNSLLVEMDGFNNSDEILVIAASNMINVLDKALLRSGRFDKKIYFDKPNINERKLMFELYLKKIKLNENFKNNFTNNINLLSELTSNCTGADIKNICNQAVGLYMKRYKPDIDDGTTKKDLCNSIDDIIVGIEKRERIMTSKERIIVSHHEAGHALTAYILKESTQPVKVSIIPRGESALGFSMQKPIDKKLYSKNELIAKICVLLGGRISEEIMFNEITTGSSDDIEKISNIAESMIKIYGMNSNLDPISYSNNEKKLSNNINDSIYIEINKIINKCKKITKNILEENKDNLIKLAEFLLKNEILISSDFKDIFKNIQIDNTISIQDKFDNI